jgi:hypothetical protein
MALQLAEILLVWVLLALLVAVAWSRFMGPLRRHENQALLAMRTSDRRHSTRRALHPYQMRHHWRRVLVEG